MEEQPNIIRKGRGRNVIYQGYMYVRNRKTGSKTYWRCNKAPRGSCSASIHTTGDNQKEIQVIKRIGRHEHEPDMEALTAASVKSALCEQAVAQPTVSISDLYKDFVASNKAPTDAEIMLPQLNSCKSQMYRARRKQVHTLPQTSTDIQFYTPPPTTTCIEIPYPSSDEKNRLFLIDTDPGLDDAQAILMALAVDSVNVLALTTVQGNSPSYCSCLNALRLLKVANRLDIPVFPGCERPMFSEPLNAGLYHGADGFGDVPDKDAPGLDMAQSEHAVNSLIRLTREHPGEITLVALGPLTNIAMAIRMEPSLGTKLKNCYIMGGNYRGIGNITRSAEFNFANDPEAAQIVLTELKCPITLCTWELCTDMQQPLSLWEKLMSLPGRKADFMKNIQSVVKSRLEISGCYIMCDELAMAAAIDERTILESQDVFAEVETHGKIARGQLISDWRNLMAKPENVRIVTKMDMDRVEELLVNSFNS